MIFGIFTKKTRAEISRRMVRFSRRDLSYETDSGPKTKTVSDPNFQLTAAATAAAATATSQQLSHLARALDHHAQGPNIPFGVNPSLRLQYAQIQCQLGRCRSLGHFFRLCTKVQKLWRDSFTTWKGPSITTHCKATGGKMG